MLIQLKIMCTIDGTIRQILSSCRSEPRANNQNKHELISLDTYENDSMQQLESDMKNFMDNQKVNFSVVEYASINKMLALCSLTVIMVFNLFFIVSFIFLYNLQSEWLFTV